jgi:hypothetical protein
LQNTHAHFPSNFLFAYCSWLEYLRLETALELLEQFFIATSVAPSHIHLASRFFPVRPPTCQELSTVLTDHNFHLIHGEIKLSFQGFFMLSVAFCSRL